MAKTKNDIKGSAPEIYHGTAVTPLIDIGTLRFVGGASGEERREFLGERAETELFLRARERAAANLAHAAERQKDKEIAEILHIHVALLEDEDVTDAIRSEIRAGHTAEAAVRLAADSLCAVFDSMGSEYLRARSADLRDVLRAVSAELHGGSEAEASDDDSILVAREFSPAEISALSRKKVRGIVALDGSVTSHAAITARAATIPAVFGLGDVPERLDGARAVIDGEKGEITVFPTDAQIAEALKRKTSAKERALRLRELLPLPCRTANGRRILLCANATSLAEATLAAEYAADGIGLFRSEFLFLNSRELPSEERQFGEYRALVAAMGKERPVVIRALDVGSDKPLPGGEKHDSSEANPALGVRGIRFLLSRREIFITQIRAILRAAAYGNVALMLPMISCEHEVREARKLICAAADSLAEEGIPFGRGVPVGIMIETPAAAIMADKLARVSDFFSVGTNDLCQYTLAADRQNSALGDLFGLPNVLEPVFRLIERAAGAIHASGNDKWIGICGELAADASLTQRFIDCGADELSVSPTFIPTVKEKILNTVSKE